MIQEPKKLPQIRRFLNYFLPTTLKILNAYDRMDAVGISGENIDATKTKVEAMMGTIVKAFDKQLDSLFGAEAMDISTDITVMENLLAQEGLAGPERPRPPERGPRWSCNRNAVRLCGMFERTDRGEIQPIPSRKVGSEAKREDSNAARF